MAYPFVAPFVTQLPTLQRTMSVGSPTSSAKPTRTVRPFGERRNGDRGTQQPFNPNPTDLTKINFAGKEYALPPGMSPQAAWQEYLKRQNELYPTNPEDKNAYTGAVFNGQRFPGGEDYGTGWTRFQDGSFVDYNSLSWKNAMTWQPTPDLFGIWSAIPDSWKADMMNWDNQSRLNWLRAESMGSQWVLFNGKMMLGNEAAVEIRDAARNIVRGNRQNEERAAQQKAQESQNSPFNLAPTYFRSPFI